MNVTRGKSSVIILRLIVILQGTSSISGVDKECESCYSFHDDIMTWLLSRQQCSVAGGDLVVMETKEEWAFITEQIQTKTVPDGSNESFIGMEIPDNWKKGEPLKWKNGANFTLTDKWQSGKPTANEGEQRTSSVLISRDYMFKGSLNSIGYDLQRGRICEYKKDCSQAGRVPRCIGPTTATLTTETIAASQLTPSSSATTTTIRTNTKTTESAITTSLSTSLPVILPTSSKSSSALSLEVLVVLVLLSVACIILIIIVCVWKHQHREKKRPRNFKEPIPLIEMKQVNHTPFGEQMVSPIECTVTSREGPITGHPITIRKSVITGHHITETSHYAELLGQTSDYEPLHVYGNVGRQSGNSVEYCVC
ncbi:uncharacterized protein LOC116607203 [Nematostella vectensis]|uniref:uncharacterized protein LOC116607203 n=1 Tax=Nematostella vectensis TaxID=45351 RepID=UPI002077588E|nr:uncharacterized protein LOC116607203 [Nematostella vectensis]